MKHHRNSVLPVTVFLLWWIEENHQKMHEVWKNPILKNFWNTWVQTKRIFEKSRNNLVRWHHFNKNKISQFNSELQALKYLAKWKIELLSYCVIDNFTITLLATIVQIYPKLTCHLTCFWINLQRTILEVYFRRYFPYYLPYIAEIRVSNRHPTVIWRLKRWWINKIYANFSKIGKVS